MLFSFGLKYSRCLCTTCTAGVLSAAVTPSIYAHYFKDQKFESVQKSWNVYYDLPCVDILVFYVISMCEECFRRLIPGFLAGFTSVNLAVRHPANLLYVTSQV